MITFIQLSPLLAVMITILLFKRPPVQAALIGTLLTLFLWIMGVADPIALPKVYMITQDTLVLFLSAAFVMAPGLLLVIFLERTGANQELLQWVQNLKLPFNLLIIFIVLGLAPFIESMTGFGVSLIVTVPLLIILLERATALKVALLGMCIMPWGTLGLATVIGAALAGLPANVLGAWSAWTSAPVFIGATFIALWLTHNRTFKSYGLGLMVGIGFILILYVANRFIGPEIAGVTAAGLIIVSIILWSHIYRSIPLYFPHAAWPYALLLVTILLMKGINLLFGIDEQLIIQGEQISWKIFASPGIALIIVNSVLAVKLGVQNIYRPYVARVTKPLLTIFLFFLMSQLLVKAGFMGSVSQVLNNLDSLWLTTIITFFGGISGYLTGSAAGGNAIMMPTIAAINPSATLLPIFSAIQNSAAAHVALGSISMVVLIISIAGGKPQEEQSLIRFALGLVMCNLLVIAAVGYGLTILSV